MGPPRLAWNEIPLARPVADTREVDLPLDGSRFGAASVVNMGNPHAVFFVGDVAGIDLERWGPRYETHPIFPEKANISFAEVRARDRIALRVWERGVGATLACGSAACATLVSAARLGLTDRAARVDLPGGELVIEWREGDDRVLMTGPVEFEREVVLEIGDVFSCSERVDLLLRFNFEKMKIRAILKNGSVGASFMTRNSCRTPEEEVTARDNWGRRRRSAVWRPPRSRGCAVRAAFEAGGEIFLLATL